MKSLLSELERRVLLAIGLAPSIASMACGAKVVIEEGEGGSPPTPPGTGAAPSQGGEPPQGAGGEVGEPGFCPGGHEGLLYACFQSFEACPPSGSKEARSGVEYALEVPQDCTDLPELCWCEATVSAVRCGPDPDALECCYYAEATVQELCEGRPFMVGGRARVAPLADGLGWGGAALAGGAGGAQPAAAALDPHARAVLAAVWEERGLAEHASVASFARFTLELLAVGAPSELVQAAVRAGADEIDHARSCFEVAGAISGTGRGPGPLPIDGALGARLDAAAIVFATVREGCIGETLSALGALAARDAATEPRSRAALVRIAEDETRHAELAWRVVAWALAANLPGAREAAQRAFAAGLGSMTRSGAEGIADRSLASEVARAHGVLPAAEDAALLERGFAELIAPAARVLLGEPRGSSAQPFHAVLV